MDLGLHDVLSPVTRRGSPVAWHTRPLVHVWYGGGVDRRHDDEKRQRRHHSSLPHVSALLHDTNKSKSYDCSIGISYNGSGGD
ncbi:hypothetical protein DY000_02056942 [Brassica cretica]|uniref:Uncharacterized protein n=1 Tax=Brassica cretica TaxID=69181 RepID=A0ABQ7AAD3_BRACR|nr:hypothetical protein DY000_02056942 [Brassica cretica]